MNQTFLRTEEDEEEEEDEDSWFVVSSLTQSTLTAWARPSVDSSDHHSGPGVKPQDGIQGLLQENKRYLPLLLQLQ